jgi:hypothetical protein
VEPGGVGSDTTMLRFAWNGLGRLGGAWQSLEILGWSMSALSIWNGRNGGGIRRLLACKMLNLVRLKHCRGGAPLATLLRRPPGFGAPFAEFLAGTDTLQVLKCYLHEFGCRMLVHFMAVL